MNNGVGLCNKEAIVLDGIIFQATTPIQLFLSQNQLIFHLYILQ